MVLMLAVTYADTTRECMLPEGEARSTVANSMGIISAGLHGNHCWVNDKS